MKCTWLLAKKIPCRIVRCCGLWYFIIGTWFDGVNQVREEYSVLDEENWNIVSDEIYLSENTLYKIREGLTEISLIRVEPSRKAVDVSCRIGAPS
jgi:hypothetical protein